MAKLQRRLVEEGLLPEEVLTRRLEPVVYDDRDLERLVDALTGDHPFYHYSNMRMNEIFTGRIPIVEICSVGPRVIPVLTREMHRASGQRKVQLAQTLAMLGSREAVPVLAAEIERLLDEDGDLPFRREDFMYVQLPPDYGAMPDVAYLLYSLGMTADERSVPVWEKIVKRLRPTEEDFRHKLKGTFLLCARGMLGCGTAWQSESSPTAPSTAQLSAAPRSGLYEQVST
ncbi:hypothetical protein [Lihuaxuella thermophila]|uniref:Uncharacterized protein n=1 Tax=Lihuaxuella thermophila TaxID=1173111 RepID=A0A1H8JD67_9BACL|nr:hypothetical protein [Lihuaxuella thermophila]SEN78744.1 hypothetical protein SAMN05444955_1243 [Lihuaxuella thermophila]